MTPRIWPRAAALAVAAVAALVVTPPAGNAAAASGPAAPGATPAPLVRIPFPQEDGSLTPYTFEVGYSLVTLIYDTLMSRDENGTPQPWLARSVEGSPDGRSFSIRLREGPRWHDGLPLTAADVAFTFRYVAGHPSPRFTPEVRFVDRVEAPDPATVLVTLKQPSPGFADQTLADLPILPAHIWQSLRPGHAAPDGLPVGSGPYRLTAHAPGQSYRFDANPEYFLGTPRVRTIVMPIITDAEKTLAAFEAHAVDMVPISLPENDAARLDALGDRIVKGPDYLGGVLMMNVRRAPFDRAEVRQAVSRAIDPARVAQQVGNAVAANRGYVHPDSPWAASADLHVLDERGARNVLSALRAPPIQVLYPDNDGVKMEAAHQVELALRGAGLTAAATPLSRSALSRAVGEDGSIPVFTMAIWNAYPLASYDPDFLSRAFGSDPGATLNYPGYRNPAFDAVAGQVAFTTDPAARHATVHEELEILADDPPVVPLYYPVGSFAYRPAVYDGWVYVKGTGILDRRSFVGPRTVATGPTGPGAARPSPPASAGDGPPPLPLALGAGGLILIAAIGALVELLRRR